MYKYIGENEFIVLWLFVCIFLHLNTVLLYEGAPNLPGLFVDDTAVRYVSRIFMWFHCDHITRHPSYQDQYQSDALYTRGHIFEII